MYNLHTPLNYRFFLNRFPACFNLFVLLFLKLHALQWLLSLAWSESQLKKSELKIAHYFRKRFHPRYLGIIHLVRTRNIRKKQLFLPSDTHTCGVLKHLSSNFYFYLAYSTLISVAIIEIANYCISAVFVIFLLLAFLIASPFGVKFQF